MKIYMLNAPFTHRFGRSPRWQAAGRSGTLYYPLWLSCATGVLEEDSHEVRLVDAPAWDWNRDDVMKDVVAFCPDMVVVDTSFVSLANDIVVGQVIKGRVKDATVVLVGPPASQSSEEMLSKDGIDVVARFEYEFTLRELARVLESGGNIAGVRGISYKQGGKVMHNPDRESTTARDLDKMPFVSRVYKKHLNVRDYFLGSSLYPEVQIFAGRGCPHQCTFCSWPETFTGRKYRVRSAESIVDELEYIKKELSQVREVFVEDDTFTIDKKVVRATCDEIRRRNLNIVWSCNVRAEFDYETMREMRQAGCRLIIVGFESGNDEILRNIKKGITAERMRKFNREAKKAGLIVQGDFIIGLPGETQETVKQTLNFIGELRPGILQVSVATPIPGTEFHRWASEHNFISNGLRAAVDGGGFQKSVISYPELSSRDIEVYVDKALSDYYLSASYIPIAFSNILRKTWASELKMLAKSGWGFLKYLRRPK